MGINPSLLREFNPSKGIQVRAQFFKWYLQQAFEGLNAVEAGFSLSSGLSDSAH